MIQIIILLNPIYYQGLRAGHADGLKKLAGKSPSRHVWVASSAWRKYVKQIN
jgi:hypothetical protein